MVGSHTTRLAAASSESTHTEVLLVKAPASASRRPRCHSCRGVVTRRCAFPVRGSASGRHCRRALCDHCAREATVDGELVDLCAVHLELHLREQGGQS